MIIQWFNGEDHPSTGNTINNIGIINACQWIYDSTLTNFSKALQIYTRFHNENHPKIKMIQENIIICHKLKSYKRH